ncbi:MAG: sulfopyruvate decarboxylase subunit alpha [Thaumarchaeota archaeon]|nr:sulfopyruvate decarboxylase subunit alpha [Nitrososphaerota archaeon]
MLGKIIFWDNALKRIVGSKKMGKPLKNENASPIDFKILASLQRAKVNFFASVPCSLLAGILREISDSTYVYSGIAHVPVTREEEGVALCAGADLGGARPCLLMQNSGLGNSINALLSLTGLYQIGLFLLIGFRGIAEDEKIDAQIPMGKATLDLLGLVGAKYEVVKRPQQLPVIEKLAGRTFKTPSIGAALLLPELWN